MDHLNSILPAQLTPDITTTSCTVEQLPQEAVPQTLNFGKTLEEVMIPFEKTISSVSDHSEGNICNYPEEPSLERGMNLPEQVFPLLKDLAQKTVMEVTKGIDPPQVHEQKKALLITAYGIPVGQGQKRDIPSEEIRIINEAIAALENTSSKPGKATLVTELKETETASANLDEQEHEVTETSEEIILTPYSVPPVGDAVLKDISSVSDFHKKDQTLPVSGGKGPETKQTLSTEKESENKLLSPKKLYSRRKDLPREKPVLGKAQMPDGKIFEKREKIPPSETSISNLSSEGNEIFHAKPVITASNIDSINLQTSGNRALGEGIAHVISLIKNEKGEKRGILRVEPPELGKVKIVVNSSRDEVHIHLTVERPEAGDLIKESEDVLRDSLKRQGLALGDLSVDVENNGEREHFKGKNEYDFHSHTSSEPELVETEEDAAVLARIDLEKGILHWIA